MQDRESIVIKSDPQVLRWQLVLQHFNFTRVHMHNSDVGPVVCFLYLLLSLFGSFIGQLLLVLRWQVVLQQFNFARVHVHTSCVRPVVRFLYLLLSLFGSFIGRLFFSPCVYVRSALAPVYLCACPCECVRALAPVCMCARLPLCMCARACLLPVCVCLLAPCMCMCALVISTQIIV